MVIESAQAQIVGIVLAGGCISFGLISLFRERSRYRLLKAGKGGLFASARRYRRRLVSSSLLLVTGLLIFLGMLFFPLLGSPLRLMGYIFLIATCCLGIVVLLLLDVVETSRALSSHYDKMIQDSVKLLEDISKRESRS